jgi:hypothetical protein
MDDITFAFCFCFSSSLLAYTFCAYPNMVLFFQFSSFCNFKQKPEELKGGGGGGMEAGGQDWGWLWCLS